MEIGPEPATWTSDDAELCFKLKQGSCRSPGGHKVIKRTCPVIFVCPGALVASTQGSLATLFGGVNGPKLCIGHSDHS